MIYNHRLLAFAEKLKTAEETEPFIHEILFEWPHKTKIFFDIRHNAAIFSVLAELSDEWYFNKFTWNWELKTFEDMTSVRACMEWFGLTPEEFVHLFDLDGLQDTIRYGGTKLTDTSKPSDYANNIIEFVYKRSK
ncbi:MAG: hypothetical protein JWO32_2042 [Bacteroidetes bacterium]|nr:hypothetical protein [Bacteroidota bacterium]